MSGLIMRRPTSHNGANGKSIIRCAVYTRKSSEEGLQQDFNSLDAQRESCEAYILSQKHEGWTCLPEMYDDGGISGGTLARPALRRLLADIESGLIDTVVVYKVDRLTRALNDFAKIVDVFDKQSVSFVSVTQQFNTTTSMGRLTLNMLLSFAQFEREVTGERIRDKIAASKKKGMWMGGNVPLGYDAIDRKLVINPTEAETVRHIYLRYAELGSVRELKDDLDQDGIVSKSRIGKLGSLAGGKPMARGALYLMLQNRLYRGDIVHKDKSYPGEHDAIIDETLWNEVQNKLATNRDDRVNGSNAKAPSLLAGLIYDDAGNRMTPSHANKNGRRYRYYVSNSLIAGNRHSASPGARRVPAADLEALVEKRLCQFLETKADLFGIIEAFITDVNECNEIIARSTDLAQQLPTIMQSEKRKILRCLIQKIILNRESLEITINPGQLPMIVSKPKDQKHIEPYQNTNTTPVVLTIPAMHKRAGIETRLIFEGPDISNRKEPDRSMLRLLGQAHQFRELVMNNRGRTISQLAKEAGVGGSYFSRILRLSFLSPDIVKTIMANDHPVDLTARQISRKTHLPAAWNQQHSWLKSN